jgi:tetratricopeptide (TPR) repeat protein
MLGDSFVVRFEHVKGLGLLEQARALAVESGDREVLGDVCNSLGGFHLRQGEHEKAIEEYEQARAIAVELADHQGEGIHCHNMGISYRALKQYDKAIKLFEQSLAVFEDFGDKSGQAGTCLALGRCLSRRGQHGRAVACLKHTWAVYQELSDEMDQLRAANALGEALWARARAEHHQAAPDATSSGDVSAAAADTLQEAETWLRTALDLAVKLGSFNVRMSAQMHLAYVAMLKGDEDEAVELLSQHLQGWLDDVGPRRCAGCGQVRGEDAPMLRCDGCRVARCVYAATFVCCAAASGMLAVG